MRVDQRAPLAAAATILQRRSPAAAGRFTPAEGPARPASTAAATGLATLDALIALQGEEDPAERRRRHARRGHDLLDGLDRLKAALLGGEVSAEALRRLQAQLAAAEGTSGDARLDSIVGQIALRAAVELAKLGAR